MERKESFIERIGMVRTIFPRQNLVIFFSFFVFFFSFQNQTIAVTTDLREQFIFQCINISDVNEHLPILSQLSSECESVVEIGVREAVTTWGILNGLAENGKSVRSYTGIDLRYPTSLLLLKKIASENEIEFTFWKMNDMEADIPFTDMLFIDSLHTYCHLTYELEAFSANVRKYIALHDTSDPWGYRDDKKYHGDYSEYPEHIDRRKKGLWPAVVDFLAKNPEWKLKERRLNNHGFTVLERVAAK